MYKLLSHCTTKKLCSLITTKCRTHTSYIVLLPEEPLDTPENNALLRTSTGEMPDFSKISGENCFSGVSKLALDFETGVWDIEAHVRDNPDTASFSSIILPLDELDGKLNVGWATAKTLYAACQDNVLEKHFISVHERARKARVAKFRSLPIYNACKVIRDRETLDECQQRVVNKFLLEARLNGMELNERKGSQLESTIKSIEARTTQFKQKVQYCGKTFGIKVSDPEIVKDFPPELLAQITVDGALPSRGPWKLSLNNPGVYEDFLAHCPNRSYRWNAHQTYNMRASKFLEHQTDNSLNVEEIRDLRKTQANLLGYDCFADMSMETKMAGSVENVLSMITSLMVKALPCQAAEMSSLKQFADSLQFEGSALQAYDVPYYNRLQRQHLYSSCQNLHEFFPLEHVLTVMLQLACELFGVEFEEHQSPNTWHPTVRFFNIVNREGGGVIASFFLDPYARPGKKLEGSDNWFISMKGRSTVCSHPVGSLVFKFPPPHGEQEGGETAQCLLSLSNVTALFAKFGEGLQHLLTTVPYGEVSGLTNMEWDAMAMTQHFMANWVFVPEVLTELGRHYRTGDSLTQEQVSEVIASANHMAGHKLTKDLYKANLDMMLYTTTDFWPAIQKGLWSNFMPYQLDKNDDHVLSFTESLCNVWAAAYYSHTWARMMAADCTHAFLEEGRKDWPSVGLRFRNTFLSLGGGCHSGEVFRRFRGRDPSPDALTALYGIASTNETTAGP